MDHYRPLAFVALVLYGVVALETGISSKMEEYKVVPDIIPKAPDNIAEIKYGDRTVNLGNELTPTEVYNKPSITWPTEEGAYYTLIMNDPDIPPNAGFKEVQHWLVVNIPGNDISKGETLFDYVGSGPPEGSGFHRYIFLVYKQPSKLSASDYENLKDDRLGKLATRLANTTLKLQTQLKLEKLIAGNFYRAQYDENVPKMGTGLHRYTFLVYKQDKKLEKSAYEDITDATLESRRSYLLKNLLKRFNFNDASAGNFYRAQYDESVPKLHAERRKKYEKKE